MKSVKLGVKKMVSESARLIGTQCLGLFVLGFVGQTHAQPLETHVVDAGTALTHIQMEMPGDIAERQTVANSDPKSIHLVFFRPPLAEEKTDVISVFVQGSFHTALLPGAYSPLCILESQIAVRARLHGAKGAQNAQQAGEAALHLLPQPTPNQYITFKQVGGVLVIESVPEHKALPVLKNLRLQEHTLSRVAHGLPCSNNNTKTAEVTDSGADGYVNR